MSESHQSQKGIGWIGWGQERHAVGDCKAVRENRKEVIGDMERVTRNSEELGHGGAGSSRGQGDIKGDRER